MYKNHNFRKLFLCSICLLSLSIAAQNNPDIDCPAPPDFLVGDYQIDDVNATIGPDSNTENFESGIYTITGQGNTRTFQNSILDAFNFNNQDETINLILNCGIIQIEDVIPGLSCDGGNTNLIFTSTNDANSTTYSLTGSDESFIINYIEDPLGSCGGPFSSSFSINKVCSKPQDILFSNATTSSVDVSWLDTNDTSSTSSSYTIEYGLQGFTPGTGQLVSNVTGNSATISNLNPNTDYDIYVSASCSSSNSELAGPFSYGFFDNSDFTLAPNGVTCLCPNANIGDVGSLNINGELKTFTKRTRADLDTLIQNDINDPQIALTCTSDITDMSSMFSSFNGITSFNQNIESWDVSNVTNMLSMFLGQSSFNQPLNSWDVSNVTNMFQTFAQASSFNQSLDNWDVGNVTNMISMFSSASTFNQPLNNWDVSNVTNMNSMLADAFAFNQDLSNWAFIQDVVFNAFLNNSGLDTANYDSLLQSFDNQNLTDKTLGALGIAYCDEQTRNNLINNKNWTISGDVQGQCGATFNPSTTPFVTTWTVDNDLEIELLTVPYYNYNFTVDWGDGQVDQNLTSTTTHNYASPGTYTVSITGVFPYFKTCENVQTTFNCSNANKLSSVESWGNQEWRNMVGSFSGAENLVLNTSQAPDLNNINSMQFMFTDADNFNQDINNWDVSNVSNMSRMFASSSSFNQPLNNWDVSNVTDMSFMFILCSSFDQPLNSWDVSNVTNMAQMLAGTSFNQPLNSWNITQVTDINAMFALTPFNQPLDNWDVSNVTNMSILFQDAANFNQDISNWDVSNVENMGAMFRDAANFNQDISTWDVSNVENMGGMFSNAAAYNQPLNNWDVSNVEDMRFMFSNAAAYNQPLNNWDTSSVENMNTMFSNATNFNQDLTSWCVEQFDAEPTDFSINSALQNSFKPEWGVECENLSLNQESLSSFKLFPNPVKAKIILQWPNAPVSSKIEISIYTVSGKIIHQKTYTKLPESLDLTSLSSGIYLLKLNSSDQSIVKRIIKK